LDHELSQKIRYLAQVNSVNLSTWDEEFLIKSFNRTSISAGFKNPLQYYEHLIANAQEADSYFKSLYITYTQFFREPLLFAYLEHKFIPNLIRQTLEGSEIRVWSAGCSTGQEAYSLAILFDEQLKSVGKELRLRIFATDVSTEALAIAENGVYSAFEMQNVRLKHIQTYFSETNEKYTVARGIRDRVTFSYYNLLDTASANPPDSIFGNFDLVCCNNLLMYYKNEIRMFILQKIERSLAPMGVLTVSEAERAFIKSNTGFQPVTTTIAMFHKPGYAT